MVSIPSLKSTRSAIKGALVSTRGDLQSSIDKVRGSTGGPTSATGPRGNKYTTKNLAYPTGVETDPTQGHYIIFEIMAQKPGQLKAAKKKQEARVKEEKERLAIQETFDVPGGYSRSYADTAHANVTKQKPSAGKPGPAVSSIQMKKATTVKMDTMIALYMPPSVQVSYDLKYGDQEIGALAETGGAMLKAFQARQGGIMDKVLATGEAAIKGAGAGLAQFGMTKVAGLAQGADALISIERGQVITPRMELLFEGVGRRNFSYSFVFIPKSEQEAETIETIVQSFKFHMAPEFANNMTSGADGVREMTIPDHFNIRYMYKGQENDYLNKISTCALTKMDVDYGAERFTGYAGGRPQTTKISLNFTEFNIMDKAWVSEGY